nr:hypothetical protein [Polaribacter butkevichii]
MLTNKNNTILYIGVTSNLVENTRVSLRRMKQSHTRVRT